MKVISKKPLTLAEVKELIGKDNKKHESEGQELDETRIKHKEKIDMLKSYVKRFIRLDIKKANELVKELKKLSIMNLSDEYIIKIVDILPEDQSDVRKIFSGSDISLKQEDIEKILGIVSKYRKEKQKTKKSE